MANFSRPALSPARRQIRIAGAALLLTGMIMSIEWPVPAQIAQPEPEYTGADRIEDWKGKTVLVVTPHPDDDTFSVGGTMALLARNGNNVRVLIYTSDNAGSADPDMTHEKLAAIRKTEEEAACAILGIPADHITWLGYDDGMLEYADQRELTKQVAREIRRIRPDAVFTIDPGAPYEQWHKSDHRMAAMATVDALRAAAWRLYFPELEKEGFKAWGVPVSYLYYSNNPNYQVDIEGVVEEKFRASAAHMSQFGSLIDKYDPAKAADPNELEKLAKQLKTFSIMTGKNAAGHHVEKFRRSEQYNG